MATSGGGGSSLKNVGKAAIGPTNTIFTGSKILYPILFQPICGSVPKNDSGG